MSTIISFANQKGGVGKTTLCTTFANYLSEKSESLVVLDCDNQQSIVERRRMDEKKYPEANYPYQVEALDIGDVEKVSALMPRLKQVEGLILIDTPGHLSQQGLLPLFIYSDVIVCPYHYDADSMNSTATFVKFYTALKERVPSMSARLVLVANRYDKRIGKASELEKWKIADEALSQYGDILPRVAIKADMMRYNTMSLLDSQHEILEPTYQRLYEIISTIRSIG